MVWRWFKQRKKAKQDKIDYNLQCCYDKGGVKLYKFHNPLKLPTVRRLMLFQAIKDAALGVNKEDIEKFFEITDDYINKAQYAQVIQAIGILKFYMQQHANTQSLFNTANCLILMEGESMDEMTPEIIERKKALFDQNADVRAFFLAMAYAYLMSLSNKSSLHLDIVDYLSNTATQKSEALFLNLITRNTDHTMKKMQTLKSTV